MALPGGTIPQRRNWSGCVRFQGRFAVSILGAEHLQAPCSRCSLTTERRVQTKAHLPKITSLPSMASSPKGWEQHKNYFLLWESFEVIHTWFVSEPPALFSPSQHKASPFTKNLQNSTPPSWLRSISVMQQGRKLTDH